MGTLNSIYLKTIKKPWNLLGNLIHDFDIKYFYNYIVIKYIGFYASLFIYQNYLKKRDS